MQKKEIPLPETKMSAGEEFSKLMVALKTLTPRQRAAFLLRHQLGYTPTQIGQIINRDRRKAHSAAEEAIKKLRQHLKAA